LAELTKESNASTCVWKVMFENHLRLRANIKRAEPAEIVEIPANIR
jgi:hypothetical protein